jgi:hypothetical protein
VAVDAVEKRGMAAGDFIEILAGGEDLFGPEGVVPVAAGEPVAGGRVFGEGLDFGEHFGEGFDAGEVDVELGAAGAAEVDMGVVEAGKDEGAGAGGVRSRRRVLGPARGDFSVVPTARTLPPPMAMA